MEFNRPTRARRWKQFWVATAATTALVLGGIPSAAHGNPAAATPPSAEADGGADILLVHGYGDAAAGKDCNAPSDDGGAWGDAATYFEDNGRNHAEIKTIGYYVGDRNCDVMLPYDSRTYADNDIAIQQIAADLAWYVHDNYTVADKQLNIVAHSMGGLITRVAMLGSAQGWDGFPDKKLDVANIATLSTPHQGVTEADKRDDRQWQQMDPDSGFMKRLHQDDLGGAWADGTDWTLVGSEEDATVSYDSGIDKGNPADQKFGYQANGQDGGEVSHGRVRTLHTGSYDLHYWHPGHPTHQTDDGWSPLKTAYQAATRDGDNLPR